MTVLASSLVLPMLASVTTTLVAASTTGASSLILMINWLRLRLLGRFALTLSFCRNRNFCLNFLLRRLSFYLRSWSRLRLLNWLWLLNYYGG